MKTAMQKKYQTQVLDIIENLPAALQQKIKKYQPVTRPIVRELQNIVGEKFVIFGDPEKLEAYSHDEIAEKEYAHMPEVVVRPAATAEIATIMKLANRELIPVTPRGAGSGLSGGAVPVFGGIVLSVDRMNISWKWIKRT